jgi:hypothetical protein
MVVQNSIGIWHVWVSAAFAVSNLDTLRHGATPTLFGEVRDLSAPGMLLIASIRAACFNSTSRAAGTRPHRRPGCATSAAVISRA